MIRRDTAENRRQRRPYTTLQATEPMMRRAGRSIAALFAPSAGRRPQNAQRSA